MSTAAVQAPEAPAAQSDLLAKTKYVLTAEAEEGQRMAKQHHLMRNVYPHLLPADFVPKSTDRILESGTANGLWAIEVAGLIPNTASVTGIDIHDRWFPSEIPANVNLQVGSITDLPQEWTSSFDLVHQRFLSFALGLSDWKRAISEMSRVLRPGGWIVLEEFETRFISPAKDRESYQKQFPYTFMVEKYVELICEKRDLLSNAPDVLSEIITQVGLSELHISKTERVYNGDRADERENIIGVWLRLVDALVKTGANEAELNKITEGFRQELADYPIGLPWYRFVARKL